MIVLAVLLLAAVIALIATVVVEGGGTVTIEALGFSVESTVWAVFVGGLAAGLLLVAGLAVLAVGLRQVQERRREIEYLRKKVAEHEKNERDDEPPETVSAQSVPETGGWARDHGLGRPRPAR
ncbi:hypothetical protein [Phytoactinopolyspora mesophila]|uniref:DUF1049 domain-containing protein n=1 Tax=Phytoactinopolyspora mesophila TaxID=2650750 RepID=A0A7K3M6E7_9ACTN|nr:hypothetical protein [Phytoactinopolyspora mesophila]NDL58825.1 hypothetical protein [Phytoactinopolyspora mesophila]